MRTLSIIIAQVRIVEVYFPSGPNIVNVLVMMV